MSRHCWAAALAVVVAAALTLAPAMAGESATLRVSARVVDRCTIEVPPWVPPWVWRDREREPWRLVNQRCRGQQPIWIRAKRVLLERLRDRLAALHDEHDHDRARGHGDDRGRGRGEARGRDNREYDRGRGHQTRHPTRENVVVITITY